MQYLILNIKEFWNESYLQKDFYPWKQGLVKELKIHPNGDVEGVLHKYSFDKDRPFKIIHSCFYLLLDQFGVKNDPKWTCTHTEVDGWIAIDVPDSIIDSYKEIDNYIGNPWHIDRAKFIKSRKPETLEELLEAIKGKEPQDKFELIQELKIDVSYSNVEAKCEWNESPFEIFGVFAITSDILAWGGSDCWQINEKNIDKLIVYYSKWKWEGLVLWYCEEQNYQPQLAVQKMLKESGFWEMHKSKFESMKQNESN